MKNVVREREEDRAGDCSRFVPDIVGYSKRLTNEQRVLVDRLNQVVRSSDEFKRAEAAIA